MASAFASVSPRRCDTALVVGTHRTLELPEGFRWIRAAHPTPDASSVEAARLALAQAAAVPSGGMLVVLLSGGSSSLLALPVDSVPLEDKQATIRHLLRAGADIHALNAVRKHISAIKGGQLAAACGGRTLGLALSDVVDDDLSVIGSGPTVPDPTTFEDAWIVIERFGGATAFPGSVVRRLSEGRLGRVDDTPKPGHRSLTRADTRLIGGRHSAMDGARAEAERLGYVVELFDEAVTGEARDAGAHLARVARELAAPADGRCRCLLWSGETTVTVRGQGRGGRNQELALAAASALVGAGNLAILSAGTDGIDGPTDAAGAIVDSSTWSRASRGDGGSPDPAAALQANDSYRVFEALGDLVRTGPTDTNVGDVQIALVEPRGDR